MASSNDWVSRDDIAAALAKVLAANNGDWDKVNANMVASELGKPRANKTIYKHFADLKREKVFGAATSLPEPTPEQNEKYMAFCRGVHAEAGTFWMQDAERRLQGYRETAEEAIRDRDALLDYLDDVEANSGSFAKERDALKVELQKEIAASARKDEVIRDRESRLEEARRAYDQLQHLITALGRTDNGHGTSAANAADAAAALAGRTGAEEGDLPLN